MKAVSDIDKVRIHFVCDPFKMTDKINPVSIGSVH